jgi:hypothetical protein
MRFPPTAFEEIIREENGYGKNDLGIDDTDSNEGRCTTYLGALLLEDCRNTGI